MRTCISTCYANFLAHVHHRSFGIAYFLECVYSGDLRRPLCNAACNGGDTHSADAFDLLASLYFS